jgi:hypothetical protein
MQVVEEALVKVERYFHEYEPFQETAGYTNALNVILPLLHLLMQHVFRAAQ